MFHAKTELQVKANILAELAKVNSYVRVVFATQALGMGVDTKNVKKVIHITPSSSLESYFQEIGRAGRDGSASRALLYFNNNDIGANRSNVSLEMKDYCRYAGCLREYILKYLGFKYFKQEHCCSSCHPEELEEKRSVVFAPPQVRATPLEDDIPEFRQELKMVLQAFNAFVSVGDIAFAESVPLGEECISEIINNAVYANKTSYFIQFGVWDDDFLSSIYGIVCKFCPMLE